LTPLGLGWPNIISVFRVVVAPVLVVLILLEERTASYAAAGLFVAAALTDGLDGYLARRHSGAAVTRTGQWLDPLADKVLVLAPVVVLTAQHRFPLWAAAIIVARELLVSTLRAYLGWRGLPMPASPAAKVKTTAQLVAITLYILPLGPGASEAKLAVLVIAIALTVATGLDYGARAGGLLRGGARSGPRRPA
jgi:CDP-diacylglycerol--glycerol-3-phosphate 3-phosphatidyltransferase